MELESESGSKIPISPDSDTQIGRQLGLGFGPSSPDRSVSRCQLSLRPIPDPVDKFRIEFQVIGKNPIWVSAGNGGDGRIYKKWEKGELRAGDKLSLSLRKPSFWVVRRREGESEEDIDRKRVLDAVERRVKRTLERRMGKDEILECEDDEGIGVVDVSGIDPVKEFGFLVKGHEFDQYPKKRITGFENWNWFLEENTDKRDDDGEETDDEATSSKGMKVRGRDKKKNGGGDDDDDWTGESDEEKVAAVKGGSIKRSKYSTRSKDTKRLQTDASAARKPVNVCMDEAEEVDEEDETLGGFIVDEEEVEEEVEDKESEEEFDDEEEDYYYE